MQQDPTHQLSKQIIWYVLLSCIKINRITTYAKYQSVLLQMPNKIFITNGYHILPAKSPGVIGGYNNAAKALLLWVTAAQRY